MTGQRQLLGPLHDGMAALGLEADFAAADQLLDYLDLLVKWGRVYNLTAVRDPQSMVTHHLLDCLAVISPLRRQLGNDSRRILDVGSGAGLPGVVIAALQPQWSLTCVDSVGKKAGFIRQVASELGLSNLESLHGRVEICATEAVYDAVVSRAFASLGDFVGATRKALAPSGVWMAMKGAPSEDEAAALPRDVTLFHVEQLVIPGLEAQRCLAWLRPAVASP